MKVVAFNCSARKDGNTAVLIERVLDELRAESIETEHVQLAGKRVEGCTACMKCAEHKDGRCYGRKDYGNECIEMMHDADGIIIGSPVYFADISPEAKALIDRAGYVAGYKKEMLYRKVGAGVIAVRRAGAVHALDSINHLFLIRQMVIAGSSYWNLGMGREKGEVVRDEEGMRTMENLGKNMAWLLKKLHG